MTPSVETLSFRCPKCESPRIRNVSPVTSGFHRCDSCEYVFRPEHAQSVWQHLGGCTKCGSFDTAIIGRSGEPPLVHERCRGCGHVSSRAAIAPQSV